MRNGPGKLLSSTGSIPQRRQRNGGMRALLLRASGPLWRALSVLQRKPNKPGAINLVGLRIPPDTFHSATQRGLRIVSSGPLRRREDTRDGARLFTQFFGGEANAALEKSVQVLQPVHLNQVAERILKGESQRQCFGLVAPFFVSLLARWNCHVRLRW